MKFGWCVTGQHKDCRKSYTDWNKALQSCSCDCHKDESGGSDV